MQLLDAVGDALALLGQDAEAVELDAIEKSVDVVESDRLLSVFFKKAFEVVPGALKRITGYVNAFFEAPVQLKGTSKLGADAGPLDFWRFSFRACPV